jgi:hypothetical protein
LQVLVRVMQGPFDGTKLFAWALGGVAVALLLLALYRLLELWLAIAP